eukprot:TRINITY_DN9428_c0_g1_i2.p1 TRINITY_DN9428_c0_g1~~TRINITY_DN9428_c0_g1_i2.p1  ORF type:complete len:131 (+),score=22.83 TRINITY_DN9428_c0_g1_i2:50-394(+)
MRSIKHTAIPHPTAARLCSAICSVEAQGPWCQAGGGGGASCSGRCSCLGTSFTNTVNTEATSSAEPTVLSLVTVVTNIQYLLAEKVRVGRVIEIYWGTEAARAAAAHTRPISAE